MALDMALLSGAAAFVDGWLPLPWIRCLRLPEIVAQFREHMLAQVRACCCSVCACAVLCTVGCVAVWLLAPPPPQGFCLGRVNGLNGSPPSAA